MVFIIVVVIFIIRAFLSVPFGSSTPGSAEISMLTFNIYYPSDRLQERMEALGQIVEDLDPDFLAFQEVKLNNLALLRKQRWFSRYNLIPPDVSELAQTGDHFVVTLSRHAVDNWKSFPFENSPFNRYLLVTETTRVLPSKKVRFAVGNTHLEHAKENNKLREEHLGQSLEVLSKYDNVCVMGDMNIMTSRDGEVVLPSPWVDVWLSMPGGSENNGYTFDNSKNPYLPQKVLDKIKKLGTVKPGRVDRVFCKLSDFKVKTMRIVDDQFPRFGGIRPSDHFGLYTVVQISAAMTQEKHVKSSETDRVYFRKP